MKIFITSFLSFLLPIIFVNAQERFHDQVISIDAKEAIKEIKNRVLSNDLSILYEINHQDNADGVNMDLDTNYVIGFGNPKAGTVLMQKSPDIGMELPLKIHLYQDESGDLKIRYPNMKAIASDYGLEDHEVIQKMNQALNKITEGL
ncbi:MAG: DUF302 domain-containing protein [Cyclobacteriaceae bacterium]|nr:DUF302 domain-containing protein [Cyclobacteriaceae bacterium]MCH8517029.1 DUF302 domain-containing protein [Cyclobacteriaceae bacterium]